MSLFDKYVHNVSIERLNTLISDYRGLKQKLNELTKEIEDTYSSDIPAPSVYSLYNLEDKCFSALIDATCCYQDICTTVNRLEENEDNRLEVRRMHKLVDGLEPIQAEFYYDFLTKNEGDNNG